VFFFGLERGRMEEGWGEEAGRGGEIGHEASAGWDVSTAHELVVDVLTATDQCFGAHWKRDDME